jgi:hypothetical protein
MFIDSVLPHSKHTLSITEIRRLTLVGEITVAYSAKHMKRANSLYGTTAGFLNIVAWRLKAGLTESRRAPSAKQRLPNTRCRCNGNTASNS